jgi:hypothetical protein
MQTNTLTAELLAKIDAYWRAANYLSVGQIYLYDNPLLKRPLALADVKHMLLGHWGTTPGQNFIYAHLNRVIKKYDLNMIYVSGPGHGVLSAELAFERGHALALQVGRRHDHRVGFETVRACAGRSARPAGSRALRVRRSAPEARNAQRTLPGNRPWRSS